MLFSDNTIDLVTPIRRACNLSDFGLKLLTVYDSLSVVHGALKAGKYDSLVSYLNYFYISGSLQKINNVAIMHLMTLEEREKASVITENYINEVVFVGLDPVRVAIGLARSNFNIGTVAEGTLLQALLSIDEHISRRIGRDSDLLEKAVYSWGRISGFRDNLNVLMENKAFLESNYLKNQDFATWMDWNHGFSVSEEISALFLIRSSVLASTDMARIEGSAYVSSLYKSILPTGIPIETAEKVLTRHRLSKKNHVAGECDVSTFDHLISDLYVYPLESLANRPYEYLVTDFHALELKIAYASFNRYRKYLSETTPNGDSLIGELFEGLVVGMCLKLNGTSDSRTRYKAFGSTSVGSKKIDAVVNDRKKEVSVLVEVKSGVIPISLLANKKVDKIRSRIDKKYIIEGGFSQLKEAIVSENPKIEFDNRICMLVVDDPFLANPMTRDYLLGLWMSDPSLKSTKFCILQIEEFRELIDLAMNRSVARLLGQYLSVKEPIGFPFPFEMWASRRYPDHSARFASKQRDFLQGLEAMHECVVREFIRNIVGRCTECNGDVIVSMISYEEYRTTCLECSKEFEFGEISFEQEKLVRNQLSKRLSASLGK